MYSLDVCEYSQVGRTEQPLSAEKLVLCPTSEMGKMSEMRQMKEMSIMTGLEPRVISCVKFISRISQLICLVSRDSLLRYSELKQDFMKFGQFEHKVS